MGTRFYLALRDGCRCALLALAEEAGGVLVTKC